MSTTKRVLISVVSGVIAFFILLILGVHPSNMSGIIVLAITITGLITANFRKEI